MAAFNSDYVFTSFDDSSTHIPEFAPDRHEFSKAVEDGFDGPILPPPLDMLPEEGYALREWRRLNEDRLEEKVKREKELLAQIIDEADEYKLDFHRRRQITCESNKVAIREKEKLFATSLEKFYAEADKDYWKAIAELVPNEMPKVEKKVKKDEDKKPSVMVIQGPKPGKPTDLARMRQILVKLKHNAPEHLKHPVPAPANDAKSDGPALVGAPSSAAIVATPEAVCLRHVCLDVA